MTPRGARIIRPHKQCAHAACARWFRPLTRYASTRYCSRACAAAARPHGFYVAIGRQGGRAKAEVQGPMRRAQVLTRLAGLTALQAYTLGRRQHKANWGNRLQSARREGFSEGYERGYEVAMQDLGRRAANARTQERRTA